MQEYAGGYGGSEEREIVQVGAGGSNAGMCREWARGTGALYRKFETNFSICTKIGRPIRGIYKSLTDTWM